MTDHAVIESLAVELRAAGRSSEADAIRRAAGLQHMPTSPCMGLAISAEICARSLALDLVAPVLYRRPGGQLAALEYRGARCEAGLLVGVGLVGAPAQRQAIICADHDSVGAVLADAAAALAVKPSDEMRTMVAAAVAGLSDECRGAMGVGQ
jgi:hypothetical protein